MARGMSPQRDRPYDRVLKSERDRGAGTRQGRETAARSGEAKSRSRESARDMSPDQRGGMSPDQRGGRRPHTGGPTYRELYAEATRRGVRGRSRMTKAQLERAVGRG